MNDPEVVGAARFRRPVWWSALLVVPFLALSVFVTTPITTDTHNDVPLYYAVLGPPPVKASAAALIAVEPFFRVRSEPSGPNRDYLKPAVRAKPVFVAALRAWAGAVKLVRPDLGHRPVYFSFVFFTLAALFLAVVAAAASVGLRFAAAPALVSLMGPWSYVYVYYGAYTQLSMALLVGAWLLTRRSALPASLGAGVVCWAALLTNPSILVYVPGIGLVVGLRACRLPAVVRRMALFGIGFLAPFALLELLARSPLLSVVLGADPSVAYESPASILFAYYQQSAFANHFALRGFADVPKFYGLLLLILANDAYSVLALVLAVPVLAGLVVSAHGYRDVRPRTAAVLLLPALLGVAAIDLRPGVQLGRSYFIALPFLVLAAFYLWRLAVPQTRLWLAVAPVLWAAVFAGETASRLREQRLAFHAVEDEIASFAAQGQRFAILRSDRHADDLMHLVQREHRELVVSPDTVVELGRMAAEGEVAFLITGPDVETVLTDGPRPTPWDSYDPPVGVVQGPGAIHLAADGTSSVDLGPPRHLPFFGLYPLLLFEDEIDEWRYIWGKFDGSAYSGGVGSARVWPIVRVRPELGADARPAITGIYASSWYPGHPPALLLRDGPPSAPAWRSAGPLGVPEWIDVELATPLGVQDVSVRAEVGPERSRQRAPRSVEVYGGPRGTPDERSRAPVAGRVPGSLTLIASGRFEPATAGAWSTIRVDTKGARYERYRLVILDHHGATDYVAIQDLRLGVPR